MNTGQALEHPGDEIRPHGLRRWQRWLLPAGLAIALAVWQVLTKTDLVPSFLLPSPSAVAFRFVRGLSDASLARHTLVTLSEVLAGLLLGVLAAALLGYSVAKSAAVERLLSPYIVASRAIPVVATALCAAAGSAPTAFPTIMIAALIASSHLLMNTVVRLISIPASRLLPPAPGVQEVPGDSGRPILWTDLPEPTRPDDEA